MLSTNIDELIWNWHGKKGRDIIVIRKNMNRKWKKIKKYVPKMAQKVDF